MSLFSGEIAAIFLDTVHGDHMIRPFPNAAADELGVLVEQLVIVPYVTGAIAHGMGILAEEYRHGDIIRSRIALHVRQRRIHHGVDIRVIVLALAGSILGVDQTGIVPVFGPADHFHMVAAMAAFVARGPDDDAGMVLEILHHPLHPLQKFISPFCLGAGPGIGLHIVIIRNIGQTAQETVGLDIRFTDHIQADLIAELNKSRCGRIMRGADAVHIQLLHQEQIGLQLFVALTPAPSGAGIMVIHTMELHSDTVDQQCVRIGNFDFSQAGLQFDDLTVSFQFHGVKEWLFRVPKNRVFGSEFIFLHHRRMRQQRLPCPDLYIRTALQTDADGLVVGNDLHIPNVILRPL